MNKAQKVIRALQSVPLHFIPVYTRTTNATHLVDSTKYKRVSRSKTLCGLPGKKMWKPDAAFWRSEKICTRCLRKA